MRRVAGEKGFTLIEIAIALGVLIVGVYLLTGGLNSMRSITEDTLAVSANERQIISIVDNIRTGIEQYQINFDYSDEAAARELGVEKLPMGWDVWGSGPRKDCKTCRGTYGFVVQPFDLYRGLYKVTLRVTHKSWSEPYRDYIFVVTVK